MQEFISKFIHTLRSKKKKIHSKSFIISFKGVTTTWNTFILSNVFLNPTFMLLLSKSAQRQSQQQQMGSGKKGEREMYLPYLIALGSICGNIPVVHLISKKFNCLHSFSPELHSDTSYLHFIEESEKDALISFSSAYTTQFMNSTATKVLTPSAEAGKSEDYSISSEKNL